MLHGTVSHPCYLSRSWPLSVCGWHFSNILLLSKVLDQVFSRSQFHHPKSMAAVDGFATPAEALKFVTNVYQAPF